jgi:hypothetical protein
MIEGNAALRTEPKVSNVSIFPRHAFERAQRIACKLEGDSKEGPTLRPWWKFSPVAAGRGTNAGKRPRTLMVVPEFKRHGTIIDFAAGKTLARQAFFFAVWLPRRSGKFQQQQGCIVAFLKYDCLSRSTR